ncbi:MAG: hypothetical protein J6386_02840 [Candidatus Synoicihabitans palmerolidicus]|nr:hypothetical protein [Candidatus Synoicihabitans palmerolidicus]
MARGEIPILHIIHDNVSARKFYERLGFTVHRETAVCVVTRH